MANMKITQSTISSQIGIYIRFIATLELSNMTKTLNINAPFFFVRIIRHLCHTKPSSTFYINAPFFSRIIKHLCHTKPKLHSTFTCMQYIHKKYTFTYISYSLNQFKPKEKSSTCPPAKMKKSGKERNQELQGRNYLKLLKIYVISCAWKINYKTKKLFGFEIMVSCLLGQL